MISIDVEHRSPFFSMRPSWRTVSVIVLHADESPTAAQTLGYLCDPATSPPN